MCVHVYSYVHTDASEIITYRRQEENVCKLGSVWALLSCDLFFFVDTFILSFVQSKWFRGIIKVVQHS